MPRQVTAAVYNLGRSGRRIGTRNRIFSFDRNPISYTTSYCSVTTSSGQCFQGAITYFYDCNCFYTYYPDYNTISANCPVIGSQCGTYW